MKEDEVSRSNPIRSFTEARLALGQRTWASDTKSTLRFALDHAKAQEAVASGLDIIGIQKSLLRANLSSRVVNSAAGDRSTFIKRPDLGRQLSQESQGRLRDSQPTDVALILGDGLSAIAANLNGPAFMIALAAGLQQSNLTFGEVLLAQQSRVALGDRIAMVLKAKTVVIALGERPGLSSADSLGVYVTYNPERSTQDSQRNCVSNVRDGGTSPTDAAWRVHRLIVDMHRSGKSGVALNEFRSQKNQRLNNDS